MLRRGDTPLFGWRFRVNSGSELKLSSTEMGIIQPLLTHYLRYFAGNTPVLVCDFVYGTRWSGDVSYDPSTVLRRLTLRLLMSYIYMYIYICIYIYMERLFLMFLDHTQRRSTVGRTPLDE